MLRTVGWIASGMLLGLTVGVFLGAKALEVFFDYTNPGRPHSGEFAGLDLLVGGFFGAVVGTIVGAVIGAAMDAKLQRRGRE
jgi:hypothetical protein